MYQNATDNRIGEFLIMTLGGFVQIHFALGNVGGDFLSGNESNIYYFGPVNINIVSKSESSSFSIICSHPTSCPLPKERATPYYSLFPRH
jgi:hypothetical protein